DAGEVVVPGLDVGLGGEDGERARGAGALVTRGGQAREARMDRGEEAAQLALAAEKLGDEIADMRDLHLLGLDAGGGEGAFDRLLQELEDSLPLAREVALEVGLVP